AVRFVAAQAHRFARVIANSRYMRDRFVRGGFPEERTLALPYFCPIDPSDSSRAAPARPAILFIGRARANKGYRYFIEALGHLPADVCGILVGDFSANSSAEVWQIAAACGCAERLELRPWASRDAIGDIYAQATVAVVPSLWAEPLGIVGLEA